MLLEKSKMKTRYTYNKDNFINIFGGESWREDTYLDDYGIQIGDVSIYDLSSEVMKELARQIVNHLLLNGHKAEIWETGEQDQKEELVFN